ncbi:FMN-binding glutamate synthase family protein [Aestuariispira insulae]|uniref:Glutamate synthase domain-containing protein 2 n=1 Tax=Aestuariispira insulae TaxID=1461337 RepID=A0A3D9HHV7_9PROT|nr:FMN-binding glutamate synthase family protein [Aestuariispira insulae]RED49043.1 glutamate synthase domain-containing protein 2 [Aestuariispira insulae]
MEETFSLVQSANQILVTLLILGLGIAILVVAVLYILDVTQTKHAIRRNFPVIGRFRYFFEHMGEFFRQYFFAQDREEMPFNRAQRSWIYRSAKNLDNTIAFGSTRDLSPVGTILFVNGAFPPIDQHSAEPEPLVIGPYCREPYSTRSFFNISGMSFGAISKPAIRALSKGAKESGAWMNTGEGGLSPYHLEGGADIVFQIGTAKYGVRDAEGRLSDDRLRAIAAHDQMKMIEIKLSQGAKPGKGGILPGAKVTEEIAAIRGIPAGCDSISPNRHPEHETVADMLDMIAHVREVTGKPTGLKAVIGAYGWLEDLFTEINRRGIESAPDFFTIDSADGGTGAAPMGLMDYMGLPLKESLPLVVDLLHKHGLRDRVRVIAGGKLVNGADVAWALAMGADFCVSARGFMFALGCIQALQCNKNTCPTGITTHDPGLQKGLDPVDKSVRVAHYKRNMEYSVGVIAHSCGVREPRDLRRYHCRVVQENGRSVPLEEIYPEYRTGS